MSRGRASAPKSETTETMRLTARAIDLLQLSHPDGCGSATRCSSAYGQPFARRTPFHPRW
jgi:hypothetical protein